MTVEKTKAITLNEILGIRLECQRCKVRTTIPFLAAGRFPTGCGYCGDTWVVNGRNDLHQKFLNSIVEFMNSLRQIADGANNVNCEINLEIKPEPISDGSES